MPNVAVGTLENSAATVAVTTTQPALLPQSDGKFETPMLERITLQAFTMGVPLVTLWATGSLDKAAKVAALIGKSLP